MPRPPLPPAEPMKLFALAEVARGGMGSVELCRVVEGARTGEILAVKRLHAVIAEDPEFVAMFLDEAWITAALKHPNVARVIAWGEDEIGTYLAIELVQGVSLSRLLKEAQTNQEPFAERTVAYICSQILAGLGAAHTLTAPDGSPLGIVHRDLTPANVLVSFDGEVKIIDFGIAKAEERITHTRSGQLKGKPSYMAPEQQRGGVIDHRADIFSFGVLMFELLAGRRPWMSKGAFDVMMEIANDPHPDLGELRKGLNPEFVAIAHKCLEKKPEARFQSVAEIKTRLDAWLAAKGFSADDQQSLANFVKRNSLPQLKWWEEALRGEHAKKKAPTFKELEEKIDEEREKAAKAARAQAPRPAAGAPAGLGATAPMPPVTKAPARLSGTQPMSAYTPPPSQRQPASDPNPPVSVPRPMSDPPISPVHPSQRGYTPQLANAGTEYMVMSPVANLPLPPPQARPAPVHDGGSPARAGSAPMPPAPLEQRWPVGQPTPIPGSHPGPAPQGAPLAASQPAPASMASQAIAKPGAPAAPKRSHFALILVLVAIPVFGLAAAAWFFRDEVLNLVAPGGTKAPRASPAGKR